MARITNWFLDMMRLGLGLGLQGQTAGTGGGGGGLEIVGALADAQWFEEYSATITSSGGSGTFTAGTATGLPPGVEYTFNTTTGAFDVTEAPQ